MRPKPYADAFVAQFDSLCKQALKNKSRNLRRGLYRRIKMEVPISDCAELDALYGAKSDVYPSTNHHISAHGFVFLIERNEIFQAMIRLPEKERNIILLHYWHGMSQQEIAKALDISPQMVHYRKKRAIMKLASLLPQFLGWDG